MRQICSLWPGPASRGRASGIWAQGSGGRDWRERPATCAGVSIFSVRARVSIYLGRAVVVRPMIAGPCAMRVAAGGRMDTIGCAKGTGCACERLEAVFIFIGFGCKGRGASPRRILVCGAWLRMWCRGCLERLESVFIILTMKFHNLTGLCGLCSLSGWMRGWMRGRGAMVISGVGSLRAVTRSAATSVGAPCTPVVIVVAPRLTILVIMTGGVRRSRASLIVVRMPIDVGAPVPVRGARAPVGCVVVVVGGRAPRFGARGGSIWRALPGRTPTVLAVA